MVHAGIPPQWNLAQSLSYAKEVEEFLRQDNPKKFLKDLYQEVPNIWNNGLTGMERYSYIVNALTRMRFCFPDGKLELKTKDDLKSKPNGTLPWFSELNPDLKEYNIVFGHWAAIKGVTNKNNIYALDTGCVWKGSLTAIRLEDKRIFSISCADCD